MGAMLIFEVKEASSEGSPTEHKGSFNIIDTELGRQKRFVVTVSSPYGNIPLFSLIPVDSNSVCA